MKNLILAVLFLFLLACQPAEKVEKTIFSPNAKVGVKIFQESGALRYAVLFNGQEIVAPSALGFETANNGSIGRSSEFLGYDSTGVFTAWEQVWGEDGMVRDHHNAFTFHFKEKRGMLFDVTFKLFDDGLGFRYSFPEQEGTDELIIKDEFTQFTLKGDHTAWWIPADYDSYEYLYTTSKVSEIDTALVKGKELLAAVSIQERHAVNTPLTMKTGDGKYVSIHEAALTNFPGMTLRVEDDKRTLSASLVPDDLNGYKAKIKTPFKTPWRTIQLGNTPGELLTSKVILNLNEPNKLGKQEWIKPSKYVGIWWEMHLQKSSWDMASGKHGATTEHTKEYIDFAAEHGFDGVLVEGWNTGWERWIGFPDREGVFDFVTPYPDYDLDEVTRYAAQKGVEIIMHHETSAAPRTYEQQLDTAYALMQKYGMHGVKTGYVGPIIPEGQYHHGQWMVNHYRKVLAKAAQSEVMVFAHEPIKATGIRRTYPNMMAREGLRGSEFNSPWGYGNPPEHLTIVPFTRMLGGPIDYTPGLVKLDLGEFREGYKVPTTLAYQLAEYVVVYSPVQMASDLIEHYEAEPKALQFIKDVPVNWEKSIVVDGEIGEYIIMARVDKGSYDWYLGALTDENARSFDVPLSFLNYNITYEATIYRDANDADFEKNPEAYVVEQRTLTRDDTLKINLARGGGVAVRFRAL